MRRANEHPKSMDHLGKVFLFYFSSIQSLRDVSFNLFKKEFILEYFEIILLMIIGYIADSLYDNSYKDFMKIT